MRVDIALVGGGLANSLIAYRLRQKRPELDVLLLERAEQLGGRHTWSYHTSDLTLQELAWMTPLVEHSWPHHEVRFPAFKRRLASGYHSVTSERVREAVNQLLQRRVWLKAEVTEVSEYEVQLREGARIAANLVIDGRGGPAGRHLDLGYQKFLGLTVVLDEDHGLEGPILMDATVPQLDGFRFVHTLPFSSRKLLIEDTRYSDTPSLERDELRDEILGYARVQGWCVAGVEAEEEGVLPIVLSGDIEAFWGDGPPGVPRSGMRAALFHPTTGYSLPEAVRLADAVADCQELRSPALHSLTRKHSLRAWRRGRYFRLLNRMLYRAAEPEDRYRVLQHFYRLPEPLIRRFYAGRLSVFDKLRMLTGSPPVPVKRALKCLFESDSQSAPPADSDLGPQTETTSRGEKVSNA